MKTNKYFRLILTQVFIATNILLLNIAAVNAQAPCSVSITTCYPTAPNRCNTVAQALGGVISGGTAPYSLNWKWTGPKPQDSVGSKSNVPTTFSIEGTRFINGGSGS